MPLSVSTRASHSKATTGKTSAHLMLVGFCSTHHQPAAEEFLVVQFLYCAFRFINGLHLHKCKTF